MVVNDETCDNNDSRNQKNVFTRKLSHNSCCYYIIRGFDTQTRVADQFRLHLTISLVCIQLSTKEALPFRTKFFSSV